MTIVAIVAAGYVCRVLARRRVAVVTTATVAEDLGVIDREHRHENRRCVTVFTNIGYLHVCGIFAGCERAVVTADAIAGIGRVVKCRRQPASRRVAVVASIAAGDM